MEAPFFWAYEPHSIKTRPSRFLLSHCTTASVNVSQPLSLCELAWCALTVNTALSSNTPDEQRHVMRRQVHQRPTVLQLCKYSNLVWPIQSDPRGRGAESLRHPRPVLCTCSPNWRWKGSLVDLKTYNSNVKSWGTLKKFNLGGGDTGLLTLKHKPWAWFGPWYGSWPRITTLTWNRRWILKF